MAYTKLPLVTQDYALGFEDLNALANNLEAALQLLDETHGTSNAPPADSGHAWADIGQHNDGLFVSRGLCRVDIVTSGFGTILPLLSATGLCFGTVERYSQGEYKVRVAGVAYFVGLVSWEIAATTETRFVTLERVESSIIEPAGFIVRTYDLSGGVFSLLDFPFTLSVHATV